MDIGSNFILERSLAFSSLKAINNISETCKGGHELTKKFYTLLAKSYGYNGENFDEARDFLKTSFYMTRFFLVDYKEQMHSIGHKVIQDRYNQPYQYSKEMKKMSTSQWVDYISRINFSGYKYFSNNQIKVFYSFLDKQVQSIDKPTYSELNSNNELNQNIIDLFENGSNEKRDILSAIALKEKFNDKEWQKKVFTHALRTENYELIKNYLNSFDLKDVMDDINLPIQHLILRASNKQLPASVKIFFNQLEYSSAYLNELNNDPSEQIIDMLPIIDLNETDFEGNTLLHLAAKNGLAKLVTVLLENEMSMEDFNNNGDTPLHLAAWQGHENIIQICKEHNVNLDVSNNVTRCTALHYAAIRGFDSIFWLLIESGANISALNNDRRTSLELAIANSHSQLAVDIFNKNDTIDASKTFAQALILDLEYYVQEILEKKELFPINAPQKLDYLTDEQKGLLSIALSYSSEQTIRSLIQYIPSLNTIAAYNEWTVLHLLAKAGFHRIIESNWPESEVDISPKGYKGEQPIHIASLNGHINIVKLFIKNRVDIDAEDLEGKTPIKFAAENNHVHIVCYLIEESANIESIIDMLPRLLFQAVDSGHLENVKILVNTINQKDVKEFLNSEKDKYFKKAIDLAKENHRYDILETLTDI